ncbi:MAG: glycosyltransferase family 1 protein [Ginsengibacter sp.]
MTIAINAKHLLKSYREGYGNFIYECLIRITKQFPQHNFIFIFDKPFHSSFIFSANVIPVVVGPSTKKLFLLKFWYNYKIPVVLKKYRADLFITPEACSLRTKVPQVLIIHDLTFLNHPAFSKKYYKKYYEKYIVKFLNKATGVAALSGFCKDRIIKDYRIDSAKIEIMYNGVDEIFKPVDFDEREKIKEQHAQGNEYFLFCTNHNLINILKAFSVFKKWQKSSMQLLIASGSALKPDELQSLRLFKHREDVKILESSLPDLPQVIAGAYAMVDLSYFESFGVHSLEAMKCNVPVITVNEIAMSEICGDAALLVNYKEHEDIAEKMMMVFKDERLRKDLINKGSEQVKRYTWHKTAELLWESILQASHSKFIFE